MKTFLIIAVSCLIGLVVSVPFPEANAESEPIPKDVNEPTKTADQIPNPQQQQQNVNEQVVEEKYVEPPPPQQQQQQHQQDVNDQFVEEKHVEPEIPTGTEHHDQKPTDDLRDSTPDPASDHNVEQPPIIDTPQQQEYRPQTDDYKTDTQHQPEVHTERQEQQEYKGDNYKQNEDQEAQQQNTQWEEPPRQQEPERTHQQEPPQEQREYVESHQEPAPAQQEDHVQDEGKLYDDRQQDQHYDDKRDYVEPDKVYTQEEQGDHGKDQTQQYEAKQEEVYEDRKEQWDTQDQDTQYRDDTQYQDADQQQEQQQQQYEEPQQQQQQQQQYEEPHQHYEEQQQQYEKPHQHHDEQQQQYEEPQKQYEEQQQQYEEVPLQAAGVDVQIDLQPGDDQYVEQYVEPQVVEQVDQPLPPLPRNPNIVIFLADSVREEELGCYDNKVGTTPNIDSIATKGVVFSHHVAGGLTDSSSRAALMTGRLPVRFGMAPVGDSDEIPTLASQSGLPPNETTFATLLQNAGYTTGFIGKWNLGMSCETSDDLCHHPNKHGFDSYFGMPLMSRFTVPSSISQDEALKKPFFIMCIAVFISLLLRKILGNFAVFVMVVSVLGVLGWSWFCLNNPHIWSNALMRDEQIVEQPVEFEGMTERMVKEGVRFLNKVKDDNKPFLLVVSWLQVHPDVKPSKTSQGKSEREAKIQELDWGVGKVTRSLRVLGLDDNTLIYFTSAGESPNTGGEDPATHASIPGVMQWSGVLPQSTIYSQPTSHLDVTPTLVRAAGGTLPDDRAYDGEDILPRVRAPHQTPGARFIFHYCGGDLHAVRYTSENGRAYIGYLFQALVEGDPFYCTKQSSSRIHPTSQEPLSILDLGAENDLKSSILPPHQLHDELHEKLSDAISKHREEVATTDNQFTWYKQSWHAYLQPKCASHEYTCKDENNALNDLDL